MGGADPFPLSYPSKSQVFEGKDYKINGELSSFEAALRAAVDNAKAGLHSELIEWKLGDVRGTNGGFTMESSVVVRIEAWAPS